MPERLNPRFAAARCSAAASDYCNRPLRIRAGVTWSDIERAAYGAEEIVRHEYRDGTCVNCGQQEPQNEPSSPTQEEK